MPGRERSSVYLPEPVVFPAASTIAMDLPMMEKSLVAGRWSLGMISQFPVLIPSIVIPSEARDLHLPVSTALRFRHSLLLRFNRRLDRRVHLRVAGAAAEIAAQRAADLFVRGIRIHREQMLYRDHEARCAVSALRAAPISISLLNRSQAAVLTDAFDGSDLLPLATGGEQRTGEHRRAVHEHRAGSAGGIVAAALGAGEAEIAAQHVEQQRARLDGELVGKTVNAQFYEFFFHRDSASR